jgi:two-component sensor histidine kinase
MAELERPQRLFQLLWHETSPARADAPPPETTRKGFGTVVLQRVAPQSFGGTSSLERSPGEVKWALTAPLEAIIVPQLGADNDGDISV